MNGEQEFERWCSNAATVQLGQMRDLLEQASALRPDNETVQWDIDTIDAELLRRSEL